MQHLPTLKQLQYFIALAEHLSFSRAAAQCNVTQSTLSAAIAGLEEMLGQTLIARTGKPPALTPFGQDVLAHARTVILQASNITSLARASAEPLSGPLRLGIIPTIAPYLLPLFLPGIRTTYPALDLHIREDLSANLLSRLRQGSLDIVLMAFPYETEACEQHVLFEDPFVLATSKNAKPAGDAKGPPARISTGMLPAFNLLLLEDGHCLRDHALEACRLQSTHQYRAFGVTSLQTLIHLVRQDFGATLLPEMAARQMRDITDIAFIPFAPPVPARKIGLAWHKNNPRAQEFTLLGELIRISALADSRRPQASNGRMTIDIY